jgi:acyl-ACP thioesterase
MEGSDSVAASSPIRGSARANGATEIVPVPAVGRVFRSERRVRLGDVDATGRLRFDAFARYLQDIASDDSEDLGQLAGRTWVVRRALIEQRRAPVLDATVALSTFCSGTGRRWAERRVSLVGPDCASVESVTLWVHLDSVSGRPKTLPPEFHAIHDVASGGREVTARHEHVAVRIEDPDAHTMAWWPRIADLDVLGHVNNAIAWAVVEEVMDRAVGIGLFGGEIAQTVRAEVEFRDAIDRDTVGNGAPLPTLWRVAAGVLELTLWSSDMATVHITARVRLDR